jgi:hypothetical protein
MAATRGVAAAAAHTSVAAEATPGVEADLTLAEAAAPTSAVEADLTSAAAAATPAAEVMVAAGTVAVIIAKQVVSSRKERQVQPAALFVSRA